MAAKSLKILVLVDLSETPPENQDYSEDLKSEDWKNEAHILETLRLLGHQPKIIAIHNDIAPLIREVRRERPDLVFNLSEAFRGDRKMEPAIASFLELLNLPYTGASPEALTICKDKGLTKKILSYHRVRVPKFLISHKNRPLRSLKGIQFPAIVKPLGLEASEGISQLSFVSDEKSALERIRFLHEKYQTDVITEEYISGRELYVGIIGNDKLQAFPPRELFFHSVGDTDPKIATYKAKWDEEYRKKWGIKTGKASAIDPALQRKLLENCKKIYRLLKMNGYGRIDLRLQENGEFVFLEANPNPTIAKDEDFALGAQAANINYTDLVQKLILLALQNRA